MMPAIRNPRPNKHPSKATDTSTLIAELQDWIARRTFLGLDATTLHKAVQLLHRYKQESGQLEIWPVKEQDA